MKNVKCPPLLCIRIPIHRVILTAASKYFAAALASNSQEDNESEIILQNTDGRTVKAIVDFCYTGHINLTEKNVEEFMKIASNVELDLLVEKCCRFYRDKLSPSNSISTLMIADKYNILELRRNAFDVICDSFETLPLTDIQSLDHRVLLEILKCDKIQASEELMFKRLLEWFHNKESERKQRMPQLLESIRLEYIPSQVCFVTSLQYINFTKT